MSCTAGARAEVAAINQFSPRAPDPSEVHLYDDEEIEAGL
jgi:hypothetical protein